MAVSRIPIDDIGYSVDSKGTIHTRYANHSDGIRTRTVRGVETLLSGQRGRVCGQCYPSPQYPKAEKAKAPQVRRSAPSGA